MAISVRADLTIKAQNRVFVDDQHTAEDVTVELVPNNLPGQEFQQDEFFDFSALMDSNGPKRQTLRFRRPYVEYDIDIGGVIPAKTTIAKSRAVLFDDFTKNLIEKKAEFKAAALSNAPSKDRGVTVNLLNIPSRAERHRAIARYQDTIDTVTTEMDQLRASSHAKIERLRSKQQRHLLAEFLCPPELENNDLNFNRTLDPNCLLSAAETSSCFGVQQCIDIKKHNAKAEGDVLDAGRQARELASLKAFLNEQLRWAKATNAAANLTATSLEAAKIITNQNLDEAQRRADLLQLLNNVTGEVVDAADENDDYLIDLADDIRQQMLLSQNEINNLTLLINDVQDVGASIVTNLNAAKNSLAEQNTINQVQLVSGMKKIAQGLSVWRSLARTLDEVMMKDEMLVIVVKQAHDMLDEIRKLNLVPLLDDEGISPGKLALEERYKPLGSISTMSMDATHTFAKRSTIRVWCDTPFFAFDKTPRESLSNVVTWFGPSTCIMSDPTDDAGTALGAQSSPLCHCVARFSEQTSSDPLWLDAVDSGNMNGTIDHPDGFLHFPSVQDILGLDRAILEGSGTTTLGPTTLPGQAGNVDTLTNQYRWIFSGGAWRSAFADMCTSVGTSGVTGERTARMVVHGGANSTFTVPDDEERRERFCELIASRLFGGDEPRDMGAFFLASMVNLMTLVFERELDTVRFEMQGMLPSPVYSDDEFISINATDNTHTAPKYQRSVLLVNGATSVDGVPVFKMYNRRVVSSVSAETTDVGVPAAFTANSPVLRTVRLRGVPLDLLDATKVWAGYHTCYRRTCPLNVIDMGSFNQVVGTLAYPLEGGGNETVGTYVYDTEDHEFPMERQSSRRAGTYTYVMRPATFGFSTANSSVDLEGRILRFYAPTLGDFRDYSEGPYKPLEMSASLNTVLTRTIPNPGSTLPGDMVCSGDRRRLGAGWCNIMDNFYVDMDQERGTVRFYPRTGWSYEVTTRVLGTGVVERRPQNGCPERIEVAQHQLDDTHVHIYTRRTFAAGVRFEIRSTGCLDDETQNTGDAEALDEDDVVNIPGLVEFTTASYSVPGCRGQLVRVLMFTPAGGGGGGELEQECLRWTSAGGSEIQLNSIPATMLFNQIERRSQFGELLRAAGEQTSLAFQETGDYVVNTVAGIFEAGAIANEAAFQLQLETNRNASQAKIDALNEFVAERSVDLDLFQEQVRSLRSIFPVIPSDLIDQALENIRNISLDIAVLQELEDRALAVLNEWVGDQDKLLESITLMNAFVSGAPLNFKWDTITPFYQILDRIDCPAKWPGQEQSDVFPVGCELSAPFLGLFQCLQDDMIGLRYFWHAVLIFMGMLLIWMLVAKTCPCRKSNNGCLRWFTNSGDALMNYKSVPT